MGRKLNIPSVLALNTEGMPQSTVVFLQAIQDALNVVDNNVIYSDTVQVTPPTPRIQRKTAQGQAFSVGGTTLASGEDFGALVNDFDLLLQDHLALRKAFSDLVTELRGR